MMSVCMLHAKLELLTVLLIVCICHHTSANKDFPNEIQVIASNAALLPCPYDGTDHESVETVTWYKKKPNGDQDVFVKWDSTISEMMPVTNNYMGRASFNVSTKSMTIADVSLEFTGTYICEIQGDINGSVVDFKNEVILSVIDVPSAPPSPPVVTVQDDKAIFIEWKKSVEINKSPIQGYFIEYSSVINNITWSENSNDNKTTYLLSSLKPYTEYHVRIGARNEAGIGPFSGWSDVVRTKTAAPDQNARPILDNFVRNSKSCSLKITPPPQGLINGQLLGYRLKYKDARSSFNEAVIPYLNGSVFVKYNITNLQPFTQYIVEVRIYNNHNNMTEGPASLKYFMTEEDVPSAPSIIDISNQTGNSFDVTWKPPVHMNGIITHYVIFWKISKSSSSSIQSEIVPKQISSNSVRHQIRGLMPNTAYDVQVCAVTKKGSGPKSNNFTGHTDVSAPLSPVGVNVTSNSTTGIVVRWKKPINVEKVQFYKIMYELLDDYGTSVSTSKLFVSVSSDIDQLKHVSYIEGLESFHRYRLSVSGGVSSLYEKTLWGPYSKPIIVTVMTNKKDEPQDEGGNGGVIGAAVGLVLTLIILVALVVAFLFLRKKIFNKPKEYAEVTQDVDLIPIANTYATRRRSLRTETPPKRENITIEHFGNHVSKNHSDGDLGFSQEFDLENSLYPGKVSDILIQKFEDKVLSCHSNGDLKFSQEYDDINQSTRTDLTSKHSLEQDNRNKNRYINILAYDHSRVILKPTLGSSHSDYINANYIEGYEKPRAYIASQGPLPNTFSDFWRMVWEQNSAVIIMITNLTEKGRRKCDQYWPHEGEHVYNSVHVKLEEEATTAHYIVRRFKIKHFKERMTLKKKSNVEREVIQFHFTEWPDHGVPNYSLPVLQFIFKSVAAVPENSGPPVIHCSAGVGRTGTYIVIETMMRQIQAKQTVNVFSFLSHIRNQRNYMVQTEDQYVFIHDVLLEYIQCGETEVKDFSITQYIKDLIKRQLTEGSLLEKQFKLVTAYRPKDYDLMSSNQPINKDKVRSQHILPEELSRVRLPMKPGIQGSDYINASYFQGYNKTQEYIVTQHPLDRTKEDFWRMVWDHNSMTIVLLSEEYCTLDDENYVEFWPHKDEDIEYGNFLITFTGQSQMGNMLCRDFLLQSTQDDYECTTRLISTITPWPKSCSPLHTVFELVDNVKKWHNQHEVEGPIVVVDRYGGKEAATFCALSTLKDQLEQEHYIDVYMTAKLYHLKRPGVYSDTQEDGNGEEPYSCQDDYMFLYKAIESYYSEITCPTTDKDSGIGNGLHYHHGTLNRESLIPLDPIPSTRSPEKMPPPAVVRSMSRNSSLLRGSGGGGAIGGVCNGESAA